MRHRKTGVILGRTKAPRASLLKGLVESLVLYEKMTTTAAKARAIKPIIERAITLSKVPSLAHRRQLLSRFHTEQPVKKLLEVLGPRYTTRAGGYTRITKLGRRMNDGADEVRIELV